MNYPYEHRLTMRLVVKALLLMFSLAALFMAIGAAYVVVSLA